MAVKKLANGTWGYDVRHPVTKRRIRVGGFPKKSDAEQAKDNLRSRWRAEKYGLDSPDLSVRGLHLNAELLAEADRLAAQVDGTFQTNRSKFGAHWLRKIVSEKVFPDALLVTGLQAEHLNQFVQDELRRGIKPNSVKTYLVLLRGALQNIKKAHPNQLSRWIIPTAAPIPGSERFRLRKLNRVWTNEELSRVLSVLRRPEDYPKAKAHVWRDVADFLSIAALTGMRKTEILLMEWSKIFFEWKIMQVRTLKRKGNEEMYREIPLVPELAEILLERKRDFGESSTFVFPRWETNQHAGWIYDTLNIVCPIAGVPYGRKSGVVPHGLRHTAATKMVAGGVDIATAADILGNSIETMLTTYAHTTMDSKRAALERMSIQAAAPDRRDNVIPIKAAG